MDVRNQSKRIFQGSSENTANRIHILTFVFPKANTNIKTNNYNIKCYTVYIHPLTKKQIEECVYKLSPERQISILTPSTWSIIREQLFVTSFFVQYDEILFDQNICTICNFSFFILTSFSPSVMTVSCIEFKAKTTIPMLWC